LPVVDDAEKAKFQKPKSNVFFALPKGQEPGNKSSMMMMVERRKERNKQHVSLMLFNISEDLLLAVFWHKLMVSFLYADLIADCCRSCSTTG